MITINKPNGYLGFCEYKSQIALDYRGLSTDTKPECVANGSTFLEIDTGAVFCFDAENNVWHAW